MDIELQMQNLRQGNSLALENLYLELKNSVFALCFSLVKNYQTAQDLMQDTFISVKQNILQYTPNTNAKAWILTIAKNKCFNHIKKYKRLVLEYDVEDQSCEAFKAHDESGIISLTIRALKKTELQIVLMHTLGDVSLKEISSILNLPQGTVRWKYSNALKKIQKKMEEEQYEN